MQVKKNGHYVADDQTEERKINQPRLLLTFMERPYMSYLLAIIFIHIFHNARLL